MFTFLLAACQQLIVKLTLCMYVYFDVSIYVCIHVYVYVFICMYVLMSKDKDSHIRDDKDSYMYSYIWYTCMYKFILSVYVFIYVYMHSCIHCYYHYICDVNLSTTAKYLPSEIKRICCLYAINMFYLFPCVSLSNSEICQWHAASMKMPNYLYIL